MLHPLDDDIWHATSRVHLGPGFELPLRMTVIRLSDGSLLLYSPIEIDAELAAELDELGQVRCIIAPNTFHHLHLESAQRRFPAAKTYGPAGLAGKVKKPLDAELDESLASGIDSAIRLLPLGGMPKFNEWVLLHEPSKTLVVADLVFNVTKPPTWFTGLMNRLGGVYRRCGISRIFKSQIKDREAFARSARALLQHPFERIAMGHGDILERGGRDVLRAELAPYL